MLTPLGGVPQGSLDVPGSLRHSAGVVRLCGRHLDEACCAPACRILERCLSPVYGFSFLSVDDKPAWMRW